MYILISMHISLSLDICTHKIQLSGVGDADEVPPITFSKTTFTEEIQVTWSYYEVLFLLSCVNPIELNNCGPLFGVLFHLCKILYFVVFYLFIFS